MTPLPTSHERKGAGRKFAWIFLLVVGCAMTAAPARAQSTPLPEYTVKAALLFNFAKYADWPPEAFSKPDDPIVIGVLGDDPFGDVLDRVVRGRVVNGHPFVVRRASGTADLKGAHLVFISAAEPQAVQECAVLEGFHVLTVGDTAQMAAFSSFNFAVENDKVVFMVDLSRATRAGVKISSKLLSLAKVVKRPAETMSR